MRFIIMLLVAGFLLQTGKGYTQENVRFNVKKYPLGKLLRDLADTTNHPIVMSSALLKKCHWVTLEVHNMEFSRAVAKSCLGQPVRDSMDGRTVFILPADLKGRVIDETGEPLCGVTVTLSDTARKTITNDKGEFWFAQALLDSFVDCSAINRLPERTQINDKTRLIITLRKKISVSGDTITVISDGIHETPPERVSGSFVVISSKQLNLRTSTDLPERLDNIVAGVQLPPASGQRQAALSLIIRGISTLHASRQPLVIVDKFPYDPSLSGINPNDIETVTILKDAAATSIWGTRAGNGVVVITTRRGRFNQPARVSFSSNFTVTDKPDSWYLPRLGPAGFIEVEKWLFEKHAYDGVLSSGYGLVSPAVEIMQQARLQKTDTVQERIALNQLGQQDVRNDYDNYFYSRGLKQQYALNIQGGLKQYRYYLGAGYDRTLNGFTAGVRNRFTLTTTNTWKPVKNLEITTTAAMIQSTARNDIAFPGVQYPYDKLASNDGAPMVSSYGLRQSYKDGLPAGKLLDWNYRPLQELAQRDDSLHRLNLRLLTAIRYRITTGLYLNLAYQYLQEISSHSNRLSMQSYGFRDLYNRFSYEQDQVIRSHVPRGPIEDWEQSTYKATNLRLQADYQHTWREKITLTALAGAENWSVQSDSMTGRIYNYNSSSGPNDLTDLTTNFPLYYNAFYQQQLPNNQYRISLYDRYISWYANAGLSLNNLYMATISARIDQSNLVGVNTNHKAVPLWSAGFKWNIAEEDFNKTSWLQQLSLRTSYGYSGNIDKSISAQLTISPATTNRYGAESRTILNAANPDLRWERVGMWNTGLDFTLFSGWLSGSFEYYVRRGKALLDNSITGISTGAISYRSNSASLAGHGVDLRLESHYPIGQVKVNSILLFDFTTNMITADGNQEHYAWDYLDPTTTHLRPGWPATAIFSFRWAGLDHDTGDPMGYAGGKRSSAYETILTNPADSLIYNGQATPPYTVSIGNTFRWRSLSFSFLITGKFDYCFRRPALKYSDLFSGRDPGHIEYVDHWQKPGDESWTNVPSLSYPANPYRDIMYQYASINVERADNIRVREIRLGWNLSTATFFVYAANVGILWKATDTGLDPDSYNEMPVPPSLSAGFTLNF